MGRLINDLFYARRAAANKREARPRVRYTAVRRNHDTGLYEVVNAFNSGREEVLATFATRLLADDYVINLLTGK